ncbi:hypothetical protein CI610_01629 [invertebrate metagenome]|uniref:Chitin-binding type-3 domain-containing protein n=1 Tax=invertebrate metagenome TaxID=1711999 RepID=A0A2H9T890_9ZZZZ
MAGFITVVKEQSKLVKYRAIKPSKNKYPPRYSAYWKKLENNPKTTTTIPVAPEAIITTPSITPVTPAIGVEITKGLPTALVAPESTIPSSAFTAIPVFQEELTNDLLIPLPDKMPSEQTLPSSLENQINGTWNKKFGYTAGDTVRYNSYLYQARWNNSGKEPGKTSDWVIFREQNKAYYWQENHVYPVEGFQVIHNNNIYVNTRWSRGEEPRLPFEGEDNLPWKFIEESTHIASTPWSANTRYKKIDPDNKNGENIIVVSYNGYLYINRWETQGDIPGKSDVWYIVTEPGRIYFWDKDHIYPEKGFQVVYDNTFYVNTRWTLGDNPASQQDAWLKVADTSTTAYNLWSPSVSYAEAIIVSQNTILYKSRWATRGEEPGQSDAWTIHPEEGRSYPWIKNHTYPEEGTIVTYQSISYQNTGRTRGDLPGIATVWQKIEDDNEAGHSEGEDNNNTNNETEASDNNNSENNNNTNSNNNSQNNGTDASGICSHPQWTIGTPYVIGDIVTATCNSPHPGTPCYGKTGTFAFSCGETEGTQHCDLIHPGENSHNIWGIASECS